MHDAEAFDMTSAAGDVFQVSVGLPTTYGVTSKSYPVLYVLDGSTMFATALEVSRLMGVVGETAEIIVVGIGYPRGTDHATFGIRRNYDFTTSEWDPSSPVRRLVEVATASLGKPLRLGGAPALLDFITEQVQPVINQRYRVDASDQALFGHSLGGKFAGYVLFRRPAAFAKYIISSPGFAFNDWDVFDLEEEYARSHSDLPAQVYLAAGSDETLTFARLGIVSGTARMAETLRLRSYPGLRLASEFQTRKTHLTTFTENLQRGLELCWPGKPLDVKALMDTP
jgi:predicted alpha/beta superfamily hydrolase